MNTELMEEEMRRALFGRSEPPAPATNTHAQAVTDVVMVEPIKAAKKNRSRKALLPG
jgi:hypothetical protein